MEQPTSHSIDSSTKQFGKNTFATTQQPIAVIDTKSSKAEIFEIIAELKNILQDSIKALSPGENQP
jgi:hypothetical protein